MSRVRTRVARSDWWASRKVVSVRSRGFCSRTHCENASGPSFWKSCREPSGGAFEMSQTGGNGSGPGTQAILASDAREAVDGHLGGECQQLGGAVLADREPEELGRLVDEPGRAFARKEIGMLDDVDQERDVRLDPANAKLLKRPLHPPAGVDEAVAARGDLHQHRVIEGRDDPARDRRAAVEPKTKAARRSVVRDPAVIGGELVGGIFGRDAALKGVTEHADGILVRAG